jgi:hypothetical protein
MPTAKKVKCEGCGRKFYASRSDTKFHSTKCRYKVRAENARFKYDKKLPRSNVKGISFNRINGKWTVKIRDESTKSGWKYVGSAARLEDAIALQKEILNN